MFKENKNYWFKLIKKDGTKLEDTIEAGTLEEAVVKIDNNFCLGLYKEFNVCEVCE